jgi:hypothetical protein
VAVERLLLVAGGTDNLLLTNGTDNLLLASSGQIGATLLTGTFDVADATSYTTGSFTPAANSSLLIFTGESIAAGYAPRSVPSGGSLTYEEELSFTFDSAPGVRRLGCWTALVGGSPSSMTITFTMNGSQGSSSTATSMAYAVIEVTEQNTSRLLNQIRFIGSSINPSSVGNGTSGTITSSSALDGDNRPFSWWYHRANEATTVRTNWTELFDGSVATPAGGAEAQWRLDTFETTASAAWTTSTTYAGIAVEANHSATTAQLHPKPVSGVATASDNVSPVTVLMPDGYANGDLLLAFVAADTNATIAQGGSDGWTNITDTANGVEVRLSIFAKVSDGSDALTLTLGAAVDSAVWTQRVTRHGVSNPATDILVGTAATGTDASPNPPSLTPGSSKDWLFIAAAAADDDDNIFSGGTWLPTSYADGAQVESAATASSCMLQVGHRKLTTGSAENPGVFTMGASEEWVAQTIAIPPASTGATGTAAVTETDDTSTAAGTETFTGTSAATEADDTSTASGAETFTGTSATTEEADTSTASGTHTENVTGSAAVTEVDDTSTATGTETFTGTAAATEADDTSTASATETFTGTSATTEADDTATASGTVGSVGGISATLRPVSTLEPAAAVSTLEPATTVHTFAPATTVRTFNA